MNKLAVVFCLSLVFLFSLPQAYAGVCYSKYDIGLGGQYTVLANARDASINYNDVNEDDTSIKLLRTGPDKGNQFISWLNTGLVIDANADKLIFYVDGSWYPWGTNFTTLNTCSCVDSCTPGVTTSDNPLNPIVLCVDGGKKVNSNTDGRSCGAGKFQACFIDSSSFAGAPNLYGLYGLIAAADANGNTRDPNNSAYWDQLPSNLFRTFQILPDANGFATISQTQSCTYNAGDELPICTSDTLDSLSSGFNGTYNYPIMQGALYLKIMDGYYEDNSGSYTVVVSSGAMQPMGFIASTVTAFQATITQIANFINIQVSADLSLIKITKALLLLYIAMNGVMFAMGMIRSNVSELITRLFKVGIIATAISPSSFTFFNTYIFSFIQNGFTEFATLVLKATQDPSNPLQSAFAVASGQTPLAAYDQIIDSIISPALNAKIWSMLFYKYWVFFIVIIYLGIFFILMAVAKTLILYIVAIMNMALLITLFPFMIVMILFEITKSFFDTWLKSFITNAMTIMFIFASIALIMTVLFGLLQTMFSFQVCWEPIWQLKMGNSSLISIPFWNPSVYSDIAASVTLINVAAFVVVAMMFDQFTDHIPTLAESITGGQSGIKGGAAKLGGAIGSFLKKANALNPTGMIAKKGASAIAKRMGIGGGGNNPPPPPAPPAPPPPPAPAPAPAPAAPTPPAPAAAAQGGNDPAEPVLSRSQANKQALKQKAQGRKQALNQSLEGDAKMVAGLNTVNDKMKENVARADDVKGAATDFVNQAINKGMEKPQAIQSAAGSIMEQAMDNAKTKIIAKDTAESAIEKAVANVTEKITGKSD